MHMPLPEAQSVFPCAASQLSGTDLPVCSGSWYGLDKPCHPTCCRLQVCLSVVGVLGDLCRNVEEDILPYCDEIMQLLIHNLGSNDVHRTIKPQVGMPQDRPCTAASAGAEWSATVRCN